MVKRRNASQPYPSSRQNTEDIPESEQWRIIQKTGILKQVSTAEPTTANSANPDDEQLLSPLAEEIFAALALIIPHCFLLLLMEYLIHYQYGRQLTMDSIADRMLPGIPIIGLFVFYTNRYKNERFVQTGLFVLLIASATRLVHIINHASWVTNMKQAPPLATAAVYSVVQLNLLPAALGLMITGVWIWYMKLKLVF